MVAEHGATSNFDLVEWDPSIRLHRAGPPRMHRGSAHFVWQRVFRVDQFLSPDGNRLGRLDSEANLLALDLDDGELHAGANVDAFAKFAGKYQHDLSSLKWVFPQDSQPLADPLDRDALATIYK
jgi:hypothetical protein